MHHEHKTQSLKTVKQLILYEKQTFILLKIYKKNNFFLDCLRSLLHMQILNCLLNYFTGKFGATIRA